MTLQISEQLGNMKKKIRSTSSISEAIPRTNKPPRGRRVVNIDDDNNAEGKKSANLPTRSKPETISRRKKTLSEAFKSN